MTPRALGRSPALEVPKTPFELENAIRARAYELYEQRGSKHGHDVEDWLRAEKEIRELQASITAAKAMQLSTGTQPRRWRSNGGGVFAAST